MLTSDFDFAFPQDRIALRPVPRGEARLMVVAPKGWPANFPLPIEGDWAFGRVADLPRLLRPGDALAVNDTKVLRARLHGRLENGLACEVLLLKPRPETRHADWECLAKPGRKLVPGRHLDFKAELSARVLETLPDGVRLLRFNREDAVFFRALEHAGETPLPPYIRRAPEAEDALWYQSVFAEHAGSVAAPTASLHFSPAMLDAARAQGARLVKLTLHVGAGTFRPVQTEHAEAHSMHRESFELTEDSSQTFNATHAAGGRILAVGTTAARVLETCSDARGILHPQSGETGIFIYPGYRWKAVDALFTNFHWPRSTLFMLVCSLLGLEGARAAYAEALRRGFRLFSYGDAMLIL